MVKVLARKTGGELHDTISRYSGILVFKNEIINVIEVLSAAKAPKKDGKGNPYADRWNNHMPILDTVLTEARRYFRRVSI